MEFVQESIPLQYFVPKISKSSDHPLGRPHCDLVRRTPICKATPPPLPSLFMFFLFVIFDLARILFPFLVEGVNGGCFPPQDVPDLGCSFLLYLNTLTHPFSSPTIFLKND